MSVVHIYRVNFHYAGGGVALPRESFAQAFVMQAAPVGYEVRFDTAGLITILNNNGFNPPAGSTLQIDSVANSINGVLA